MFRSICCQSGLRGALRLLGAIGLATMVSAQAAGAASVVTADEAARASVQLASVTPAQERAPNVPVVAPKPSYMEAPFDRVPTRGKAIFVNIPSFELIAFEDGREVLRSRVIVGSPKNPTPEMTTETSVVAFRPTWTPTPSMIRDEGISPETRKPGRNNPLGLLAIRFEPGNLIYLHDTNNRKLFKREKRALSHGCVRVEKYEEVAAFVLGTSVEEVRKHAEGKRSFSMDAAGVPVIIRYETEFPDQAGNMQRYADVYGKETRYAETLRSEPKPAKRSRPATDWNALPTSWN